MAMENPIPDMAHGALKRLNSMHQANEGDYDL